MQSTAALPRFRSTMLRICVWIAGCTTVAIVAAQDYSQQVEHVRLWHSPDRTRIVFDVKDNVEHRMFTLDKPLRLVVDIIDAKSTEELPAVDSTNAHISAIRTGRPQPDTLRYVFELKKPLVPEDFVLSPNELYGHRLVIDLRDAEFAVLEPQEPAESAPALQAVKRDAPSTKPFLIAIDAGHGGEDPGALGFRGSKEKQITLEIARKLADVINQDSRLSAYLVREGDYYIKLHKRRMLARSKAADMFISIHADAFHKSSARGFSVFALSQSGATSAMASALAAKENAADLIGGVSLADKDDVLAKVLVDLSMTNTISESVNFGGRVLQELGALGRLHSKRVEQAGFAVLKSPDIPSVLIETGFITNPQEEQRLRSASFQTDLAAAIYRAINAYLEQEPFKTTARYAAPLEGQANNAIFSSLVKPPKPRSHKVVRGDSLSLIAAQYGISVRELKRLNGLRSDTVMLGQTLKLPGASASNAGLSKTSPVGTPSVHKVRRGESLSTISARYNVTISALKRLNHLTGNTVYVGQELKLRETAVIAAGPRYHVVKRGDTLSEIAETYGSSMQSIMRANAMRTRTVMLGQRLRIP